MGSFSRVLANLKICCSCRPLPMKLSIPVIETMCKLMSYGIVFSICQSAFYFVLCKSIIKQHHHVETQLKDWYHVETQLKDWFSAFILIYFLERTLSPIANVNFHLFIGVTHGDPLDDDFGSKKYILCRNLR